MYDTSSDVWCFRKLVYHRSIFATLQNTYDETFGKIFNGKNPLPIFGKVPSKMLHRVLNTPVCWLEKIRLLHQREGRTNLHNKNGYNGFLDLWQGPKHASVLGCPVDTGRKLNVHQTFRRRPGRLQNVLCTFNVRPVSTG